MRSDTTDGVKEMFTPEQLHDFGFPYNIEFQPTLEGDKFVLTFQEIPKSAFEELANFMFQTEANHKLQGWNANHDKYEGGLAQVDLRMDGYRIDFTPRSWVVAEGNVVI